MHLGQQQIGGGTLREHLQAAAKTTGNVDPRLLATVPEGTSALWAAYCDLASARPAGMGASAIPSTEYEAWQRLARVQFTPWELDTLKAMDRAALDVMAEAAAKNRKATQ